MNSRPGSGREPAAGHPPPRGTEPGRVGASAQRLCGAYGAKPTARRFTTGHQPRAEPRQGEGSGKAGPADRGEIVRLRALPGNRILRSLGIRTPLVGRSAETVPRKEPLVVQFFRKSLRTLMNAGGSAGAMYRSSFWVSHLVFCRCTSQIRPLRNRSGHTEPAVRKGSFLRTRIPYRIASIQSSRRPQRSPASPARSSTSSGSRTGSITTGPSPNG